eukprot:CAMPEP_0173436908 /NCGR_PEP_ID=MMETSP1357-20121228/17564_1 /TAXON_ID=77926 /ORGANISM="Hemiselmis rufescens, Strain PCC563" /LENGTH=200 /DNA_ID=CAMNT_0014402059 /DNA_START=66 /DNA_END=664 /DNA_ORIENTATION=-
MAASPPPEELEKHRKEYLAQLKKKSSKELDDFEDRPLEKWLNSAEMLSRQVTLQKENGNTEMHYIYALRLTELVNEQLPKHPEYKLAKHKEQKKSVARLSDKTLDDIRACRDILVKKETARYIDNLAEMKGREAEAVKFDTKAVGDSLDAPRTNTLAGDALIREGLKTLPSQNKVTWGPNTSVTLPSYPPSVTSSHSNTR